MDQSSPAVTDIALIPAHPSNGVELYDTLTLRVHWEVSGSRAPGTGFALDLPHELVGYPTAFPLIDARHDLVAGECTVRHEALECTFDDYIDRYDHVSGLVDVQVGAASITSMDQRSFEFAEAGRTLTLPTGHDGIGPRSRAGFPARMTSYMTAWPTWNGEVQWEILLGEDAFAASAMETTVALSVDAELGDGVSGITVEKASSESWADPSIEDPWQPAPEATILDSEGDEAGHPGFTLSVPRAEPTAQAPAYRVLFTTDPAPSAQPGDETESTARVGATEISHSFAHHGGRSQVLAEGPLLGTPGRPPVDLESTSATPRLTQSPSIGGTALSLGALTLVASVIIAGLLSLTVGRRLSGGPPLRGENDHGA